MSNNAQNNVNLVKKYMIFRLFLENYAQAIIIFIKFKKKKILLRRLTPLRANLIRNMIKN